MERDRYWWIVVVVLEELLGRLFLPNRGSLPAGLLQGPAHVWLTVSVCRPSRHPNALRPRYAHSTYAHSLHPLLIFKELQRLLGRRQFS